MRRWSLAFGVVTTLASLGVARTASANVSSVKLFAGRLTTPESCFVQVDVEVDEQDLQNGQEALVVGDTSFGTWGALVNAGKPIAAGKSVLYGSSAFATETGITVDIEVPGTACTKIAPKAVLNFNGSFGPVAGTLTIPDDFSALRVVGDLLLIHLESQEYKVKSLGGEKSIGPFAGGASSSGGSSSGGSGSSGGASSGTSPGAAVPPSGSDDSSCAVGSRPRGFGGGLVALGLALAAIVRRRVRA